MRRRHKRMLAAASVLAGLFLMGYPLLGQWKEGRHAQTQIQKYETGLQDLAKEKLQAAREEAEDYNRMLGDILIGRMADFSITEMNARYEELLNVNGDGIMGYVSIPKIDVTLPIDHKESTTAACHLKNTSLPVGGSSTHAVIAAHTGLSSSRQFTDLTSLEIGDVFYIYVLDERLSYQVDQILVVEPTETSSLMVERGKDWVTLLTCTPYGLNTHRLLVRGSRIPNETASEIGRKTEGSGRSEWMRQYRRWLLRNLILVPVFLFLIVYLYCTRRKWLRWLRRRLRKKKQTKRRGKHRSRKRTEASDRRRQQ